MLSLIAKRQNVKFSGLCLLARCFSGFLLSCFAIQPFPKGAQASAQFACDLAETARAKKQKNNEQDEQELGGAKSEHRILL